MISEKELDEILEVIAQHLIDNHWTDFFPEIVKQRLRKKGLLEKSTLEKARFEWSIFFESYNKQGLQPIRKIINLYEQAIKELQEKLNKK